MELNNVAPILQTLAVQNTKGANQISLSKKTNSQSQTIEIPQFDQQQVEHEIQLNQATVKGEVVQDMSVFTLFKLNNGVLCTRIRDLNTGEVKYFPAINEMSFDQLLSSSAGAISDIKA